LNVNDFASDVPRRLKLAKLEQLAEVGALERIDNGWRIPEKVWREWKNPTKAEVEAKRHAEAERKAEWRARHIRNGDQS